jgi:hypothetical protein
VAERLVVLAWAELVFIAALISQIALYSAFVLPGEGEIACFDATERACGHPDPPPEYYVAFTVAWATVLALAVVAFVTARRHRRGAASRAAVTLALSAPVVTLIAAIGVVGV